jgi:hypothetical protein
MKSEPGPPMTLGAAAAAQARLIRPRLSVVNPANPSGGSVNRRAEVRRQDFHCGVYPLPSEIGDASASHKVGQAAIAVGHGFHRLQRIDETQAGRYLRITVGPVQRFQGIKGSALVFQRHRDHAFAPGKPPFLDFQELLG